MAHLKACSSNPLCPQFFCKDPPFRIESKFHRTKPIQARTTRLGLSSRKNGGNFSYKRWVSPIDGRSGWERGDAVCSSTSAGEMGLVGDEQFENLVSEFGWRVRRLIAKESEMRRVAEVQAEAFYDPMPLFNNLFLDFFKAEVLAALIYRLRNSPPDRYACLVAESTSASDAPNGLKHGLVGVVDVTVMRDGDVLKHLNGTEEYLYVSGIAVLRNFRRRKIATLLLKACDMLSLTWGFEYLVLRTYEDDLGARTLYSNAGYKVVSGDPHWMTTWVGRKRRLLLIKQLV